VNRGSQSKGLRWKLDPRIRLFDGRIECQTCHLLGAGTDDLLVEFERKYDLCLGCHEFESPRRDILIASRD
jgi:predicted CXXCH cytochrome family protein